MDTSDFFAAQQTKDNKIVNIFSVLLAIIITLGLVITIGYHLTKEKKDGKVKRNIASSQQSNSS